MRAISPPRGAYWLLGANNILFMYKVQKRCAVHKQICPMPMVLYFMVGRTMKKKYEKATEWAVIMKNKRLRNTGFGKPTKHGQCRRANEQDAFPCQA